METKTADVIEIKPQKIGSDLLSKIDSAMKRANEGRGFFVINLQVENLPQFKKRRPQAVVASLLRDIFQAVRMAVHPSQYVAQFEDGLILVFEGVDVGHVDSISRRLVALTQNVIRKGHYNEMTSGWTDMLYQFLSSNPGVLYSQVGWAIYPRDGGAAEDILRRAQNHLAELARDRAA